MKPWRYTLLTLGVAALALVGINLGRDLLRRRLNAETSTKYQVLLNSYSAVLRPGMPRSEVEDYLRMKGTPVGHFEFETTTAPSDLIKIGSEAPPWYCSRKEIYLQFQFEGSHIEGAPAASDILRSINVMPRLEDCL